MKLSLKDITNAVEGELLQGRSENEITGVEIDSRKVQVGDLFFALKGENSDGHEYLAQAYANGAKAALISSDSIAFHDSNLGIIKVEDTLKSLQELAFYYRSRFTIPVIAVTGSIGKTTTKEILAICLEANYEITKTEGNYNNEIGLPLSIFKISEKTELAVLEMGMRGLGEIAKLARIAQANYAIITNIEAVHLEMLGSIENIAKAKCEVLDSIDQEGFALINGDSEYLLAAAKDYKCKKYTFGYSNVCDIKIKDIQKNSSGIDILINILGKEERFYFPVPASGLAYNVAAAIAMAFLFNVPLDIIKSQLKEYIPGDKRLNTIHGYKDTLIIDDSYNASPRSMTLALEYLKNIAAEGRTIAVLGDMFELGDYEYDGHLEVGQRLAELNIDYLIAVGERAEIIAEGALKANMHRDRVYYISDKDKASNFIKQFIKPHDFLLFKASRGMKFESIIKELNQD